MRKENKNKYLCIIIMTEYTFSSLFILEFCWEITRVEFIIYFCNIKIMDQELIVDDLKIFLYINFAK